MEPLQFKCHCNGASSQWIELSPQNTHRYKVQCGACRKFIKWGKEQELRYRSKAREKITVDRYDPNEHLPGATLERFFK